MSRAVAGLVAGLVLLAPAAARAAYGLGATLVSANPATHEQVDDHVQTAVISQDGRYVVFQTAAQNLFAADDPDPAGEIRVGGIFRRDLETGALEVVAYGDLKSTGGSFLARGARNPSVSADGRYIAFSTGWPLVAADTNQNVDIYVRDMTKPISSPDAYRLASVRDGGTTPATWSSPAPFAGAELSPGTSLSADGTKVLFRTGVASDLPGAAPGATPAGQLFVRDLAANTTTLVTRSLSDGSPAGGALGQPAFLSADGTTVAWAGTNAQAQTPFLNGENTSLYYYLWRRIADGPEAPTRRISGAVDLDDAGCTAAEQAAYVVSTTATGPCYGVFEGPEGDETRVLLAGKLPVLSADGYRVAFISGTFPRGTSGRSIAADLYLTDMHPGLSRKESTIPLTTHATGDGGVSDGAVLTAAISADARRIAFATGRTTFLLAGLPLVGPPLPIPGTPELYVIDLDRSEIQLASRGLDGNGANSGIDTTAPLSLTSDGRRIAFVSGATNLFPGDANTKADAFVAIDGNDSETNAAAGEAPFFDYSSAPEGTGAAAPTLELSARPRKGKVLLRVRVPAAGTVSATARARGGTVAHGSARLGAPGVARLVLRPKSRFHKLLRRRGRLAAIVTVRFIPSASATALTKRQRVTFTR
jgi:Tol biopolymer transport system component